MTIPDANPSLASRFSILEKQLEQLNHLLDNLIHENAALRQREKQLIQKCQLLDQKSHKACAQIEIIIEQLKHQP